MMFSVEGKSVVITGGGGVLGRAMAKALVSAGAKVALLGRTLSVLDEAVATIKKNSGTAIAVRCDVLDESSCIAARDTVIREFGKIDALINAAGGASPAASTGTEQLQEGDLDSEVRTILDVPYKEFRKISDLNSLGTYLPMTTFLSDLIKSENGSIINISSMGADRPLTKSPAYSAGKAAVDNMTKWMAVYLAKTGIRVNAIAPGFFLTKQNRFLLTDKETGEISPRGQKILDNTPQGRFGNPEDLVSTMFWLLSDASVFVTGVVVPVDGGFGAFGGV
ncbi:MAG: SDR family oxidoreductase [Spirochaetaceae bacterium]|nr:SDR family oxidoreductase [Spirochaetaceae bacterium]